ncbi:hypothetical protein [uncultured Roseibium sp.]|uniref:hypothetical protein n=1 Tax=uncultured Roseibium sp. TaxID=1936171 RepID=UPI0026317F1A|nr:hypothetical protein [uncultured Roseibium sp.]
MIRLLLGSLCALMSLPALACDRIDPPGPKQIFADATFIARARVERADYLGTKDDLKQDQIATLPETQKAAEPEGISRVFFRPIEVLKGKQFANKPLAYFPGMATCGVMIIPGFEYLIVANAIQETDLLVEFQFANLDKMAGFVTLDTQLLLHEDNAYQRLKLFRELSVNAEGN